MSYLELDTEYQGEDIQRLRKEVHEFAAEEVRPVAIEIDRMDDDEYQKLHEDPSPLLDLARKARELGYHRASFPEEVGGLDFSAQEQHVLLEELTWGGSGAGLTISGGGFVPRLALETEDERLIQEITIPFLEDEECELHDCWGVTEPAHGSDHIAHGTEKVSDPQADVRPPEVTMQKEGDEYVINGQKSSWVSGAPLASHCALHVNMDPAGGEPGGEFVIVPLDQSGVEQGDPLLKLGDRGNLQGEILFDDVRIPERYVIRNTEDLLPGAGATSYPQIFCFTSVFMSNSLVGLARAAFEKALSYARQRDQGGRPICEHQSVKHKLYEMFEKVDTARTYSRRICEHVHSSHAELKEASYRHAATAQAYCKRIAFEVAHEAVQIHGANGITKDYLVQKLFRDARVDQIKDGTTEIFELEVATDVIENYELDE